MALVFCRRPRGDVSSLLQGGLCALRVVLPRLPHGVVYYQVKRCGEMARKLRYFHDQIAKAGQAPAYMPMLDGPMGDKDIDLDELESKLTDLEAELLEINANTDKLQRTHSELTELQLVLLKVRGARRSGY